MYVSDSDKNEDYWAKRVKNNVAARRSREARRLKENQVLVQ
jgi:leukemia factor-related protein